MHLGAAPVDVNILSGLVAHEFGHVLGFSHEMQRQDFPDSTASSSSCRESDLHGGYLNTPADIDSIMAFGYCNSNTVLSPWDAVGVMSLYGKQVNGISPLLTAYKSSTGDNATMSASFSSFQTGDYSFEHAEGWVFDGPVTGTVPLKLYFNPATQDYFSTATAAGQASAISSGYSFLGIEGYIYPSQQPGTVPLKLYFHSHGDNMSTASTSGQNAAIGAGYTFVRNEGWVFPTIPYKTLWGYWHGGTGDNILTAQNQDLAQQASIFHQYTGMDGVVFKDHLPGTVELKTYWSSASQDHFTTATAAGEASAIGAGYTLRQVEGYVFSSPQPRMSELRTYWKPATLDNFMTLGRVGDANQAGYTFVRVEGYTFATLPWPVTLP